MNGLFGKRVLITGGTGSLGTALVKRLLSSKDGEPKTITVFSRDEAKQHDMRLAFPDKKLRFVIGDVRNYGAVCGVVMNADIVFHAAALKHVPSCEDNPYEAVLTNIIGPANIVRAIRDMKAPVETVIGVSSDKGVHPVNVYGATKFIQERLLLKANVDCPNTRFVCVCYGNVMGSRGSVIPVWQKQIADGEPVTITNPNMTRFLISLDQAVDTLLAALDWGKRAEVYIPIIPSACLGDIAKVLIGSSLVNVEYIGRRPGEKMHEVLITEEETERVVKRDNYYVVTTEIQEQPGLTQEYNSRDWLIGREELEVLFGQCGLLPSQLMVRK